VTQERTAPAHEGAEPPAQAPLAGSGTPQGSGLAQQVLGSSVGRNLGLVVALLILCGVGIWTAGEQFASVTTNAAIRP
jgi:ribose transport system permease protein